MRKPTKNWMTRQAARSASLRHPRSLRCELLEERQVLSVSPVALVADIGGGTDPAGTAFCGADNPSLATPQAVSLANVDAALEDERVLHDLGAIDSTMTWTAAEASDGSVFYRIQTTHDALLTLEGLPRKEHHEIELTVYDANFQALDTSTLVGENFRAEWETLPNETYYFTITAPALTEVTILNAIAIDDTQVTVHGSSGQDSLQFGDAQGGTTVILNGIEYQLEPQAALGLTYHGNGGGDTVVLYDTAGNDSFHVKPGEVLGWNDTSTRTVTADGFSTLHVYSTLGGEDVAYLYDSAASDKFKAEPNVAKMLHHGDYYNRVKGFSQVRAFSENGGNDVALLQGSDGDDQLTAQKYEAQLVGQSYDVSARGFHSTQVWGMGGFDTAILTDSVDDDTVRARPHKVTMWAGDVSAPDYEIVARSFDSVSLLATQGGYDRAKLHDSALDDLLELGRDSARMIGDPEALDIMYEAYGFEWVKAYSSSGNDTVDGTGISHNYEAVLAGPWNEK